MTKPIIALCTLISVIAILLIPYQQIEGAESSGWNTTLLGRWAYGQCFRVASQSIHSYIMHGQLVQILNCYDPEDPWLLGSVVLPSDGSGIAVSGDYVFALCYDGLYIIDASDRFNLTIISHFATDGHSAGVAANDSLVLIADGNNGLLILDISNPVNPSLKGHIITTGEAINVLLSGKYAYVSGSHGVDIIDVTDPANPTLVSNFGEDGYITDIVIDDTLAYAADLDGLRIFNISNPTSPTETAFHSSTDWALNIIKIGDYVYLAETEAGLQVFNVANPQTPLAVSQYDTDGYSIDLALSYGGYIGLADGWGGFRIINPANPNNLQESAQYPTSGVMENVTVAGNYAYAACGHAGLQIISIADPANPSRLGFLNTSGFTNQVVISGNYAYISDGANGLVIVDVSNPYAPFQVGHYGTSEWLEDLAVSGNYAYLAEESEGLHIIDISDPTSPSEVGSCATGYAVAVAVSGNYAYVAGDYGGLKIVNIGDPNNPVEVGAFDTPGEAMDVAVSGDYAYIADHSGGLRIVDISSATSPVEVGHTGSYISKVEVSGGYAFVSHDDTLSIYNVENPSNPVRTGYYSTGNDAQGAAISGNIAYLAGDTDGLYIIDFSEVPVLLQSFSLKAKENGIRIDWEIADNSSVLGFNIYRRTKPDGEFNLLTPNRIPATSGTRYTFLDNDVKNRTSYEYKISAIKADGNELLLGTRSVIFNPQIMTALYQNIPNPFNPTTTIRFAVPEEVNAELKVFDASGHCIKTLVDGKVSAGTNEVVWNGKDNEGRNVGSGVYFYRLIVGKKVMTRKMIFLR